MIIGDDFYKSIPLTDQEIEAALLEGKKKKYFHEKNKDYWNEKEHRPKHPNADAVSKLRGR